MELKRKLCEHCHIHDAAVTYEDVQDDVKQQKHVCLECYDRLQIGVEETEGGRTLSACPYCGTTAEEVENKKIVGCAYCYETLKYKLTPMVISFQKQKAHVGKRPPLENIEYAQEETSEDSPEAVRAAKYKRQYRELTMLVEKLRLEGDTVGAEDYEAKLLRMERNAEIEEDFVWRRKADLSNQP